MPVSDLFNNVGPGFASYNAGFGLGQQQQGTALENLLRATQVQRGALDNQFDEANLPTRIQQSAANLAGTIGQNQTRDLSNMFTQQTQDGSIAATNSTNANVPMHNMALEQQEKLTMFTGLAARASAMTPTERVAWSKGLPQKLLNDPEFTQIMANPDRALSGYRTAILNQPKAIDDTNKVQQQETSRLREIAATGDQTRQTQQQAIDAGKYAKAAKTASATATFQKLLQNPSFEKVAAYSAVIQSDPDVDQAVKDQFAALEAKMKQGIADKATDPKTDTLFYNPKTGQLEERKPYGRRDSDKGAANLADPLGIR